MAARSSPTVPVRQRSTDSVATLVDQAGFAMAGETLPLPDSAQEDKKPDVLSKDEEDDAVYSKFPKSTKRRIVFITSISSLALEFSVFAFLPSIDAISKELNTTHTMINVSVAVFLIALAISPLLWSQWATIFGKRPVYLTATPIYTLGSVGVALSTSLPALMICRVIQACGCGCMIAVGASTIADIYHPRERGGAMSWFMLGVLVGPAVAPVMDGAMEEYIPNEYGWHAMQWLMAGCGATCTAMVYFGLPETAHFTPHQQAKDKIQHETGRRPKFVWIPANPLKVFGLLLRPNICMMAFVAGFALMTNYMITTPMTTIMAPRFNIQNHALQGCLYLSSAAGNIVGSRISGPLQNKMYRRGIQKRSGEVVPEDRLKASLAFSLLVLPLSLLGLGLCIQFWQGIGGLVVSLICIFFASIALLGILPVGYTYLSDCLKERAAEAIAASNCVRYLLSAAASAFVLPLTNQIGAAGANAVGAGLALISATLILLLIVLNKRLRKGA